MGPTAVRLPSVSTLRVSRAMSTNQILYVPSGTLNVSGTNIPAATLTSPREGLDVNMHKALQVGDHPEGVPQVAPGPTLLGPIDHGQDV